MKLTLLLYRHDLLPEYRSRNCSQIAFENFKKEVQKAIVTAGKAQFREYDNSNYNAVYPPK